MTSKGFHSPEVGSGQVKGTPSGGDVMVGNSAELASSVAVEEIQDKRYEEDTAKKGSNNDACGGLWGEGRRIT